MSVDKSIKLKVTAETTDAEQKLNKLDDSISGLSDDMKEAKGNIEDVGDATDSLGESSSMLSEVISMGLVAGIALLSLAMIGLVKDFLSAESEVENLTSKLKDHWGEVFKANEEWQKFAREIENFGVAQTIESINALNEELRKIGNKMIGPFGAIIQWTELLGITDFKNAVAIINGELDILNDRLFNRPKILGWDDVPRDMQKRWKETFKTVSDDSEKFYNHLKKLEADYIKWLRDVAKNNAIHNLASKADIVGIGGRGLNMGGPAGDGLASMGIGREEMEAQKERVRFFTDQMRDGLGILRGEFTNFWESSFGEANSLLEKFLMNFASGLLELGAKSLFSSFLNILLPGSGSAFNALAGAPTVINVNMGNETLARAVVKGSYEAKRLRLSN
ncbi:hypothetical protein IT417_01115 [bacterium]|nr:hypothetical protein [bacterium]